MHNQKPPNLPRKGRAAVVKLTQNVPAQLYKRMIEEAGLGWGEVTQFINQAIREKLEREAPKKGNERSNHHDKAVRP